MNHDIQTILYACDLGEGGETALAYAIGLAGRIGARLQVLTVIDDERERSFVDTDSHVPQQALDKYHNARAARTLAHIQAQLADFYAARGATAPLVPITELIVHEGDDVPQAILDEADRGGADLILMASRGKGVVAGLLFGSATHEVLRRTHKPLLLVPVGP